MNQVEPPNWMVHCPFHLYIPVAAISHPPAARIADRRKFLASQRCIKSFGETCCRMNQELRQQCTHRLMRKVWETKALDGTLYLV